MARYSHLNDLHELEFKTLKGIHEALGIKQGLKNYVRNTNKKYGKNYAEDEVIMNEVADIIILNTLGKLKRHNEQAKYIDLMTESKEDTALIEQVRSELAELQISQFLTRMQHLGYQKDDSIRLLLAKKEEIS